MTMRLSYLLSRYVSHRTAGLANRECLRQRGVALADDPAEADIVVLHNEPWSYAGYYRAIPELRDKYVIAYAVWETDILPEHYRFNLGLVDEVWTCSSFCRDVLAAACKRVTVIPHTVEAPQREPAAEARMRERIGYDETLFYFYTIGRFTDPRKNTAAAIRAFADLSLADARLIVKSPHPLPPEFAKVPGVIAVHGQLDEAEIRALHHLGHCFVSPHRSEGWGLGLSDAMAYGKPVIATAMGGNMDFMNAENSLPLPFTAARITPAEVQQLSALLSTDMTWAYLDEQALRRTMRWCCEHRDEARRIGERGRADIQRFRPERVAALMGERLAAIDSPAAPPAPPAEHAPLSQP
jgi:glycosyltransferase involved in cell wall biosynthesis